MPRFSSFAFAFAFSLCSLASAAQADDKVVFQVGWRAEPEFGGFFQALESGIYKKHGLDVEIRLGNPQTNTTQLLLSDNVQFTNDSSLIVFNGVREGFPLVGVAGIFQKDPRILLAHEDAGNDRLEDMVGKPVLISASGRVTFWPFLREKFGFSDDQIRPYNFNNAPFMADKNAIQQGYVTNEPYAVKQLGAKPKVFLLADHGYLNYGTMIVTTQKMIDEKPEIVQRFVDASLEGWKDYLQGDPTPGNDFIKRNNPELKDDQIAYSLQAMKDMGIVESGDALTQGIGAMTDEYWKNMFDLQVELDLLPADLDYKKAYTLQFISGESK